MVARPLDAVHAVVGRGADHPPVIVRVVDVLDLPVPVAEAEGIAGADVDNSLYQSSVR
jgi:hypothetical protein